MNKNDKLESLFEVSLHIFARYGYKKTTVEDIASKLGVTKGNLYFYVKNKEDLYQKTIMHAFRKWKLFVEEGIENEKDHKQKFILLSQLAVSYISSNEDLKAVIKNDPEIYTVNSSEDRFYDANLEALTLLKKILADGVTAGVFKIMNIDYVSHIIYSVYIMYLIQTYTVPQNLSPDILFKETLDLILRGISA